MKVFLVHHIPVTHCCCRFLRPRRRTDAGARLLCVARFVVLASPTTDHPCPGQGILWSRAHGLRAQVRALSAVSWATFRSPPREFPTPDCASPPRGRLASFGKDLFWGCDTMGQGHTGIWHGSLVEQQAACKEAAALHPKGKASRAERREPGLLLPPCLDVKAQSCSSFFSCSSLWVSSPLTPVQVALPAWKQVSIHVGS